MIDNKTVLTLTTENELILLRKVIDDTFWNDTENIFCIPVNRLDDNEILKTSNLLGINVGAYNYIICESDYTTP